MTIDILGTKYEVLYKTKEQDKKLDGIDGYCDYSTKTIVCVKHIIEDINTMSLGNLDFICNRILRHEIIHAFLYESGLWCNSYGVTCWAENEEMTDWFAMQAPKIYEVYRQLNILT